MNRRSRISHVSLLTALSAIAPACDQPVPKCTIARGDFAATYSLVSGSGDCAELKGEILSIQAYNAPTSKHDQRPNYAETSIAIQPITISDLLGAAAGIVEPDEGDSPYSLGRFAHSEPSDGFCVAPELSTARLRLPEIAEQMLDMCTTTPAQPAVDIQYTWSHVRVYTTAANYGTQFAADLSYTRDDCTATYKVAAVYPAVSCNAAPAPPAPDSSDDAGTDDACPAATDIPAPIPDDALCSALADPEQGRPVGSGLSPDLAVRCDAELLLCVLDKEPPSLR